MNTIIRNILLFTIIVIFVLAGDGILNFSLVNAAPGWLTGWSYRKGHVINSATGAGTNYQVKIVVHKSSGTDSGEDVYAGTNVRDDFGDVRFTDDNGTTFFDYWMETYTSGVEATFWVEVKDNLSTTAQIIYIYYGNSTATTTSNIKNTSWNNIGDDFNDNLETNQRVEMTVPAPDIAGYVSVNAYAMNNVELRILAHNLQTHELVFLIAPTKTTNSHPYSSETDWYRLGLYNKSNLFFTQKKVGGSVTQYYAASWLSGEEIIRIRIEDGTIRFLEQDTVRTSLTNWLLPSRDCYIYIYVMGGSGYLGTDWADTFWIRKYVDPEPTHGSWFTSFLPGSPSSLGPTNYVNGSWISDTTPTLQFTQSDPDSGDTVKYRIQIDNNSDFSSPVVDYTSTLLSQGATSFTVGQAPGSGSYTQGFQGQTLPSGSYYWQVMSEDQRGETDSWTKANSGNVAFKISIGKFYTGVKNTIFSTGAVTYSGEPNTNNLIDFSITPSKGSIEVTIFYWLTSDTYYKKWKESSDTKDVTTIHIVGDLAPNTSYPVKVDGVLFGKYTSNSSGQISFVYDLGYSDKIFEVGEPPDLIPTGNNISYLIYLLPITFLLIGFVLLRLKKRLTV